jgi:hypothetical protein
VAADLHRTVPLACVNARTSQQELIVKKQSRCVFLGLVGVVGLLCLSGPVWAQANFDDGGTLTGTLTYDATTNSIVNFDLTTTSGSSFGGASYISGVSGDTASIGGFNGPGVVDFSFNNTTSGTTLFFTVAGNPVTSTITGLTGATGSLLLVTNGSADAAADGCTGLGSGFGQPCSAEEGANFTRYLDTPSYLNFSDPNCPVGVTSTDACYTVDFTSSPTYTGGSGSGGTTVTPEPSTFLLFALGAGGLLILRRLSA